MSYSSEVLADNPILYLRLQETSGTSCADSSPSGFTGTTHGTVTRNVSTGLNGLGVAVTLGGSSSDYISVPDNAALDLTGDFTYECWVNFGDITPAAQYLMSKGWDSGPAAGYGIYVVGSSGKLRIVRTGVSNILDSTSAVGDNSQWHHVVATRSGNVYTIYRDGVADGSTTDAVTSVQATSKDFIIGAGYHGSNSLSFPFAGKIDEIAVYNTALSSTRVAAHYAARTDSAATITLSASGTGTASVKRDPSKKLSIAALGSPFVFSGRLLVAATATIIPKLIAQ